MDNLEGVRTLLTAKKNLGKILRFSVIDDFLKKKFSNKNFWSGDSLDPPKRGQNFFVNFSRKRPHNPFKTKMG